MKAIPTIQRYMTTTPYTVQADESLVIAHKLMQDYEIRHLPVMRDEALVGILSERDVQVINALDTIDLNLITVHDAMTRQVVTVAPDAPLDQVASTMAEAKVGSVVVVSNGKVVGIFTTVDGMAALAELLQTRLKS